MKYYKSIARLRPNGASPTALARLLGTVRSAPPLPGPSDINDWVQARLNETASLISPWIREPVMVWIDSVEGTPKVSTILPSAGIMSYLDNPETLCDYMAGLILRQAGGQQAWESLGHLSGAGQARSAITAANAQHLQDCPKWMVNVPHYAVLTYRNLLTGAAIRRDLITGWRGWQGFLKHDKLPPPHMKLFREYMESPSSYGSGFPVRHPIPEVYRLLCHLACDLWDIPHNPPHSIAIALASLKDSLNREMGKSIKVQVKHLHAACALAGIPLEEHLEHGCNYNPANWFGAYCPTMNLQHPPLPPPPAPPTPPNESEQEPGQGNPDPSPQEMMQQRLKGAMIPLQPTNTAPLQYTGGKGGPSSPQSQPSGNTKSAFTHFASAMQSGISTRGDWTISSVKVRRGQIQ